MTSIEELITLLIKNALFFGANYTSHQVRKFEKKKKQQQKKKGHQINCYLNYKRTGPDWRSETC